MEQLSNSLGLEDKNVEFVGGEEEQIVTPEKTPLHYRKKHSFWKSAISPISNIATTKVNRLVILWIQLIVTNFLVSVIANPHIASVFGILSILPVLPLSLAISRLVNRNAITSVLIGGLVIGTVEGLLGYLIAEWAVYLGILYGAFYGASVTKYFSIEDKNTTLFWASLSTTFLIVVIYTLLCSSDVAGCLEMLGTGTYIGDPLIVAFMTIVLGLPLALLITPLKRVIESLIELIIKYFSG